MKPGAKRFPGAPQVDVCEGMQTLGGTSVRLGCAREWRNWQTRWI